MLHKMLDRLLTLHFKTPIAGKSLDRLEQDVWCKLNAAGAEVVQPWYDKIVMAFSVPRFQIISLVIALLLGMSVSLAIPLASGTTQHNVTVDMSIFAASAPYLTANIIERP